MAASHAPRVGGVLSADIAVPEHERELEFYSRILTTGENPVWREDLMNNMGMPIIGLGERSQKRVERLFGFEQVPASGTAEQMLVPTELGRSVASGRERTRQLAPEGGAGVSHASSSFKNGASVKRRFSRAR